MPSANNAPGNGSFAARISNFFATDLLPQLLKLSKDFLDQGDQRQFFNFELEFHKQALQFSDRVTEQALLEKEISLAAAILQHNHNSSSVHGIEKASPGKPIL